MFKQAKEEQEKADQAFEDAQKSVISSEMPLLESEPGSLENLLITLIGSVVTLPSNT